ncbi:MAG: SRPBCC family protein [Candidatus Limnocylindria bacterium]
MDTQTDLVVRKTVTVPLSQEAAFRLFTDGMGSWWPAVTHSVAESTTVEAAMDGAVGGHIYERTPEGTELWGTITAWNPPLGFSTTWHPGYDAALATQLSVRFVAEGPDATRVELEHRGWEVHADAAARQVVGYDTGWDTVLGHYVMRAGG